MKTKFLIIIGIVFALGFIGTASATHNPDQPYIHSIILPSDMRDSAFEEFMEWCIPKFGDLCVKLEKNRTPIILPPSKQFKSGIPVDGIQCKESLTLVTKHDGSPACVKSESVPKLIERGWANGIKIKNEWTASYYPNGRLLPNGTFDTNLENVVPWLMMQELEQHGVKNWINDPSTGAHTDEGWLNPSKMCSSLLVDTKTKLYVSSTFYSEPALSVSEIIIDDSKPTGCQKWFSIPYGVDSKTGNLLYDYDEKSKSEHYEIDIIGLKDEYALGEEYSFYFVISGYGYACANYDAKYPDENGNTIAMGAEVLCAAEQHMTEFEINQLDRKGTLGNIAIQKPGTYTVTVTFEKPNSYFPTSVSKTFEVVE